MAGTSSDPDGDPLVYRGHFSRSPTDGGNSQLSNPLTPKRPSAFDEHDHGVSTSCTIVSGRRQWKRPPRTAHDHGNKLTRPRRSAKSHSAITQWTRLPSTSPYWLNDVPTPDGDVRKHGRAHRHPTQRLGVDLRPAVVIYNPTSGFTGQAHTHYPVSRRHRSATAKFTVKVASGTWLRR